MNLEQAKEKLWQTLEKYKNAINIDGISATASIAYQSNALQPCAQDDKHLRFIEAELLFKHEDLSDEHALGFTMIVECSSFGGISEKELNSEIEGFSDTVEAMISELCAADNVVEAIQDYSRRADEEVAALNEELTAQMDKINRNLKIMKIATLIIAALGITLVIVANLVV